MTNEEPRRPDFDTRVTNLAALGDPLRRRVYRFVTAQPHPVNRDQVTHGMGIARHVAKFHLDRLVTDSLLAVEYARPPGRRGPGAGRPAKLYRRSSSELAVSVPQREYELAGRLLATAVTGAARDDIPVGEALSRAARSTGQALGVAARQQAGSHQPGPTSALDAARSVLTEAGYEPRSDDAGLVLVNCPFHRLAEDYTDLVCGMNLDLLVGLVNGLGDPDLEARLEPTPARCCVRLNTKHSAMSNQQPPEEAHQ